MAGDDQLRWIQRHRVRPERAVALASALDRWTARACDRSLEASLRAAAQLAAVVDDTFREQCRILLDRGTLTVYVQDADLLFSVRTEWSAPLQSLARAGGLAGVSRVHFQPGDGGVAVPHAPSGPGRRNS